MPMPIYVVEPFAVDTEKGSSTMLEVRCPWDGCAGEFWVRIRWAIVADNYPGQRQKTRPCPYCFRVALLPEPPKKRRVVRRRKK